VKVPGTVRSGSASRASAAVARRFRVTPWPLRWSACICNCRHADSREERLQHSLTMANVDGTHEKRGLMTACTQPGCTGRIVDGYCDVCGSPAGAAGFVPAGSAASSASPAPGVEAGLTAVGRGSGVPLRPNNPFMLGCTQQGCTGTIVDGYCDVCGSPAGAVPFVPPAASAASPAPADEPGLMAVPASTPPAPASANEEIPTQRIPPVRMPRQQLSTQKMTDPGADDPGAVDAQQVDREKVGLADDDTGEVDVLDLPWSTKTTDWIDIEESREVEAILRGLIEPAVADTAEVEQAVVDLVEGDTAEVEPAVADLEVADSAPAGPYDDDTAQMPAVVAVLRAGRHPHAPLPEQQVLGPEPVQTPAEKRRIGSLALAAAVLAALLIGAFLFAASRDGGVTARSVATVTATVTMPVSKPPSERSDQSTDTGRGESTIQLEDLAASARPFEAVRIQGTYRGGAGIFLRVQRWEGGKWLDFPLPTKTDQSGQFITQAEFGQPGSYRLRVLDPDSGVTSKPFVVVIKG
jgi:hypothetical protein